MTADALLGSYLTALAAADAEAALAVVVDALGSAVPPRAIILDLLAPAQRRVGELWYRGVWSVADEHAATTIGERSLVAASPTPSSPRSALDLRVLAACAEGEWHSMPARMAGELVRIDGMDVRTLGVNVAAADLRRNVWEQRPDVVALSVTMPTNLLGAVRCLEAAHEEGVPVVVGGRAWGQDGRRAKALGADGWGGGAEAASVVRAVAVSGARASAPELPREAWALDAISINHLELSLERHAAASAWVAGLSDWQRQRALDHLRSQARHAAASVGTRDITVLTELRDWLYGLLSPRGVPTGVLDDSFLYLADSVENLAPLGAAALRTAVA